MRNDQEIRRIATGVKAWAIQVSRRSIQSSWRAHLEHLDISNTEVKISGIAQDQTRAKQDADGEDRPDKHVLGDMDVFRSVQEVSGTL